MLVACPVCAQPTAVVVELRRTFQSIECDSGELHINGQLVALFQASPTFFRQHYPAHSLLIGRAETALLLYPAGWPSNRQGFKAQDSASGLELYFEMLNEWSFSPFVRPRNRAWTLPDNFAIIGTSLVNRECWIGAGGGRVKYNDDDARLGRVSNILGDALFGKPTLQQVFVVGAQRDIYLVLSDKSENLNIRFGLKSFELRSPIRSAANVTSGDPCLTGVEHMVNTFRMPDGSTQYRRADSIWLCTYSTSQTPAMKNAMESVRDVRFIEVWESAPCKSVMGIPVYRQYYVTRDRTGAGGAVWTRCFEDEPFTQASSTSDIGSQ